MPTIAKKRFATNTRLIKELLSKYKNTFHIQPLECMASCFQIHTKKEEMPFFYPYLIPNMIFYIT